MITNFAFSSQNLIEAIQNGVYPVGNQSQFEESNWDFSNSFFFAGTVVSTIGGSNAFHLCLLVCECCLLYLVIRTWMDNTFQDKISSLLLSWVASRHGLSPKSSPLHNPSCFTLCCQVSVAFPIISHLFLQVICYNVHSADICGWEINFVFLVFILGFKSESAVKHKKCKERSELCWGLGTVSLTFFELLIHIFN